MRALGVFLILLPLAAMAGGTGPQQPAAGTPQFKGFADQPDAVSFVLSLDPDKRSGTVIFNNLQAAVSGQAGRLVDTRSATIALPIDSPGQAVTVRQIVHGYVTTTAGARGVLLLHGGEHSTALDLKEAGTNGGDFTQEIDTTVPAGASYQMTFFLLAERDAADPDHGALVTIDSVDVVLGNA